MTLPDNFSVYVRIFDYEMEEMDEDYIIFSFNIDIDGERFDILKSTFKDFKPNVFGYFVYLHDTTYNDLQYAKRKDYKYMTITNEISNDRSVKVELDQDLQFALDNIDLKDVFVQYLKQKFDKYIYNLAHGFSHEEIKQIFCDQVDESLIGKVL